MAFVGFTQMTSTANPQVVPAAQIPAKATHAEIQADTQPIRYTCDGTNPTTSKGMLFLITEGPKTFVIDEVRAMRIVSGAGGAGNLNIHFFAGRNV